MYATPDGTGESIIMIKDNDSEIIQIDQKKKKRYRSGVGMLLYLVKFSRPDISNSFRKISKVMDRST